MVVAAVMVAAAAIWLPAYRWFLLISIGIGAAVAGGLYLWHKIRPVKAMTQRRIALWDSAESVLAAAQITEPDVANN